MARSLGTRGNNGNSLVRDKKVFDARYSEINWKSKKAKVENGNGSSKDTVDSVQPRR